MTEKSELLLVDSANRPENETASRSTSKLFWTVLVAVAETIFVFVAEMTELIEEYLLDDSLNRPKNETASRSTSKFVLVE